MKKYFSPSVKIIFYREKDVIMGSPITDYGDDPYGFAFDEFIRKNV